LESRFPIEKWKDGYPIQVALNTLSKALVENEE